MSASGRLIVVPLDDPLPGEDHRYGLTALWSAAASLATIILALRFGLRIKSKSLGLDDWTVLVSWSSITVIAILVMGLNRVGGFQHFWIIRREQYQYIMTIYWVAQTAGKIGLIHGEVAMFMTFTRLWEESISPVSRWTSHAFSAALLLGAYGTVLMQYDECIRSYVFRKHNIGFDCLARLAETNFAVFFGAWGTLIRYVSATGPLTFGLMVSLGIRRKVALGTVIGGLLFVGGIFIAKRPMIQGLSRRSDVTWNSYDLFAWQAIEIALLVILGSVPLLTPIWIKLFRVDSRPSGYLYESITKV